MLSLPGELLVSIFRKLKRNIVLSLWSVCTDFNNFCQTDNFRQLLTFEISRYLDLNLTNYSLKQLRHVYTIGKERYLYPVDHTTLVLNNKGQVHYFGEDTLKLLPQLNNIIDVGSTYDSWIFLDTKGTIYSMSFVGNGGFVTPVPVYENVIKILDNIILVNNEGNFYIFGEEKCSPRKILGLSSITLNNQGNLLNGKFELISDITFLHVSGGLLLDDAGYVYEIDDLANEITKISDLKGIIQLACMLEFQLALDHQGKVYSISNEKVRQLEISEFIIEIALDTTYAHLLDDSGRIHIAVLISLDNFTIFPNFTVF